MNKTKKYLIGLLIVILSVFLLWQSFPKRDNLLGKANLSWNPSSESDIKGYRIYYGTEKRKGDCPKDGGYGKKVDVGNRTSYQLENLENNSTYYFSVTSYNTSGKESCFSEEMSKTVRVSLIERLKKALSRR